MSWLFAVSSSEEGAGRAPSWCHGVPLWTVSIPGFYLAVGGNPDTSFWGHQTEKSSGWAMVGVGIRRKSSQLSIMTRTDWEEVLLRTSFKAAAIDGHFVAVRWKGNHVECFTDQLGLRAAYFGEERGMIFISTRLDWLARTIRREEIDFAALGSRWLLFNQVTNESCIVGIERLGPGGHATFRAGSLMSSSMTSWLPSFETSTTARALDILTDLVQCALQYQQSPSLGLSGGLDSRLLLALLASSPDPIFFTHTFGPPQDPDVQIARRIATALGLPHRHFNDPLPEVETCVSEIQSFVAQTLLIEPCSSFLKLRYYPNLREDSKLMIDGGFGEIARRQYLNRVVRLGRTALRMLDISRLLRLMRSPRADIFCPDVTAVLENGARHGLETALTAMPAVETVGVENFADLLAVQTRVPNYGAPEQARIDAEVLNFMPLVQPSFLHAVFGIPPGLRSSAGFYYRAIRKLEPTLAHFPLTKSGHTYRFGMSSTMAWLTIKMKGQIAHGYADPKPHQLLVHMREYVLDLAHSKHVTTDTTTDARTVIDAVTKYYRGDHRFRSTVDWWLTFELWKKSLSSRNHQVPE
jgi:hypothetical protein